MPIRKAVYYRVLCLTTLAVLAIFPVLAQSRQELRPKSANAPGIVSGRAFAITGAGDIKPARMAHVYLLYDFHSAFSADPEYKNSVGTEWYKEKSRRLLSNMKENIANGATWSDSHLCYKDLLAYDEASSTVFKFADSENKRWQVIIAEADEEGTFTIGVPRPGVYTLIVQGRAGLNDAVWVSDNIIVDQGVETKVRLSSPEKACLHVN